MLHCLFLLILNHFRWFYILVVSWIHAFFTHYIWHLIWIEYHYGVLSLFQIFIIDIAETFLFIMISNTRLRNIYRLPTALFTCDLQVFLNYLFSFFRNWYLIDNPLLLFTVILLFLLSHAKRSYFKESRSWLTDSFLFICRASGRRLLLTPFTTVFWKLDKTLLYSCALLYLGIILLFRCCCRLVVSIYERYSVIILQLNMCALCSWI
jgi:hypothetical protein